MAPWLAWLLPVPLATIAAIVYASWASRARGPEEAIVSVAEYDRFRSAMATPRSPVGSPVGAPSGGVVPTPRGQAASRTVEPARR